ncbi:TPA: hypothetical protein QCY08_002960 [Bacillus paranthracis]|nr:hypothetical protein [Bacillus paranthracis]
MSKIKFTGKVGTKFMSFLNGEKLHSAYYSLVEVECEGQIKKVHILDESAPKGLAQGQTRHIAIQKAKKFLETRI